MIYSPFRNIELCKVCTASTLLGMLKKKNKQQESESWAGKFEEIWKKGEARVAAVTNSSRFWLQF